MRESASESAYMHISGGGAEREREGERERIPSRLHAVSTEPDTGLDLTNPEVTT